MIGSISQKDFLRAQAEAHEAMCRNLARVYSQQTFRDTSVAKACAAADQLLLAFEQSLPLMTSVNGKLRPSWADVLRLSYWTLERALGLLVITNLRVVDGSPFLGAIRDFHTFLEKNFELAPVRWTGLTELESSAPDLVVCGIVSDNLFLFQSASRWIGIEDDVFVALSGAWTAVVGDGFEDYLKWRSASPLAPDQTLRAKRFGVKIGLSEAEVRARATTSELLTVSTWAGQQVFPLVQIVGGAVPTNLPRLLAAVDGEGRLSRWHLAIWLSQPFRPSGERPVDVLDSEYDEVLGVLQRTRVVHGPPGATPRVADESVFEAAVAGNHLRAVPAVDAEEAFFYRIAEREYGPFYFSQGKHRFDLLPGAEEGSVYFALSSAGAFDEVLQRSPVISLDHLLRHTLWKALPARRVTDLFDLSDGNLAEQLGFDAELTRSLNRDKTQEAARKIHAAGARGIIYDLFESNTGKGVALFGRCGRSQPESSGLPAFALEQAPLAFVEELWEWMTMRSQSKAVTFLPETAPIGDVPRVRMA